MNKLLQILTSVTLGASILATSVPTSALGAPGAWQICDFGTPGTIVTPVYQTLFSDRALTSTQKIAQHIPAGQYNIYYGSFNDHTDPAQPTQEHEQWIIEGYFQDQLVFQSTETADLPDPDNVIAGTLGTRVSLPQMDNLVFKHALITPNEVNSIQPICAGFEPVTGADLAIDKHVKLEGGQYVEADKPETALAVTKGQNVIWRVVVRNEGTTDATNVVVADKLPAGLTYLTASATAGAYDAATGEWSIPSLVAGQSMNLEIVTMPRTCEVITNVAQVVGMDQVDLDAGTGDDADVAMITIDKKGCAGTGGESTPPKQPEVLGKTDTKPVVAAPQLADTGVAQNAMVMLAGLTLMTGAILVMRRKELFVAPVSEQ